MVLSLNQTIVSNLIPNKCHDVPNSNNNYMSCFRSGLTTQRAAAQKTIAIADNMEAIAKILQNLSTLSLCWIIMELKAPKNAERVDIRNI